MAILQNIENLPTPMKMGIAGAAVGGAIVVVMTRRKATPVDVAQSAAQSHAGPIALPPGASADNAGEVQSNTMSLVQQLLNQYQSTSAAALAAFQSRESDQFAQIAAQQTAALTTSNQALTDQLNSQNASLLAIVNALKSQVDKFLHPDSPVSEPTPQTGTPPTGSAPQPGPPSQPTNSPVDNYAKTKYLGDVKSWIGGVQDILTWVRGSDYGLNSVKHGGKGGKATAGTTDYNTGFVLAVDYDPAKDTHRFDFSGHSGAESTYSRVIGQSINLMQAHQNLSQYEAQLMILSELKNGIGANSLYDTGFDFSNVPDNYGRGTYWK